MKTTEELKELMRQWKNNPYWDIEETEGFEDHKDVLRDFRHIQEERWTRERLADKWRKADQLGCTSAMIDYLEALENRIKQLEK